MIQDLYSRLWGLGRGFGVKEFKFLSLPQRDKVPISRIQGVYGVDLRL